MTKDELIELSTKMGINVILMGDVHMFAGNHNSFLNFVQAIRKKTVEEIIASLKSAPNPNTNIAAIKRIMSDYELEEND
jgi:hypothetical protein